MGDIKTEIKDVLDQMAESKGFLELELKASKALLRSRKILVAITNAETGNFQYVNPAFKALLGYSFKELTTKPILDFLHPDDVDSSAIALKTSIIADDFTFDGFINRYIAKAGTTVYINWYEDSINKWT